MMKKLSVILLIMFSMIVAIMITGDKGINTAKMQGYKALKVFVQIKDEQIVTSDFMEYETEHFTIKYRPEDENVIRDTAKMFEESYGTAAEEFGYVSEEKTVVVIYKDQNEFWSYQKAIQGQAVMGLYNMGTIHVLSPNAYKNEEQSSMAYFKKNGPVLHEYTHKIVDELTGGNIELWLTEGLALYEEYRVNDTEWASGYEYERYFNSREIREGFMVADEVQSYRQSFDMTKYLIDNYGMDKMQMLMEELKAGSSTDHAFLKVYGVTADEFIDSEIYAKPETYED
ncbi:MAG TPA: peptidase MA family metallohydrolase [Patescibacteria group bacterium]|nr:peptidase MA family metallohydrolase [Patescibacteria group bacterium]